MKDYSVEELLSFIGDGDVELGDPIIREINRFLYDMDVVLCYKKEEPGMWTPEYWLYYYYCKWVGDNTPLPFFVFKRGIPKKAKVWRNVDGWEEIKIQRGKIIVDETLTKHAKLAYVRSIVWEQTKRKERRQKQKAARASQRSKRNAIKQKIQD